MSQVATSTVAPADQVRALLDHRYRSSHRYIVGREKIREYARAVQDRHPAHWHESAAAALGYPGLIAPATFASIILLRVHREILDTVLTGYDPARILHADQVIDIGRPLIAGDELTCDIYFESFRHFADYDVMAIKSVLTDAEGQAVQTGSTALLARTGEAERLSEAVRRVAMTDSRSTTAPGTITEAGPEIVTAISPPHIPCTAIDPAALRVGMVLPTRVLRLSRGDLVNYAGVTGDTNPVLFDERTAIECGLPTVVAPGMLKLGLAAGYLSSWLGDPAAVTRLRAQFAHNTHYLRVPALASSPIEFSGRITSLDPSGRRGTIAIDARSHGRKLFGYAAAEVRFTE
ncbi:fused (3R)-hydroxyacyl-ACP dehydratase subunits HadA/HadB [Nocardia cyriacigeorgica]|uniref:fused (3R)-hydroxyacyl-ACP dehydratase subunits HadA/HadB n=1 Tax=Nocardia cyriacigeorgica TaxID=135487 RepID=UPI002454260D|nr:fused (3R)-hydroxyacyl-ACP dehydratase subunits HadA/HadB [Nocardia cyriacigeorgica]